jgi:hypothetical protein
MCILQKLILPAISYGQTSSVTVLEEVYEN